MNLGNRLVLAILLFIFSFSIFIINFRYVGCGDTQPNELLPISFIKEGNFDFNEFFLPSRLPYGFRSVKGKIVSAYPIVSGMLSIPLYFFAHSLDIDIFRYRFILALFSASMICSLSAVFLYFTLRNITKREETAAIFSLIYCFATPVLSVISRGLWSHTASLLFITISLFLVFDKKGKFSKYCGLSLGLAIWSRPSNVFLVIFLIAYLYLKQRNSFKWFLVMFFIPLSILFIYSSQYLDSVFVLGQYQDVSGFNSPLLIGLLGLLISPSRGILVYSPIFLFSFAYMFYMFFSNKFSLIYRCLTLGSIAVILLFSKWHMWWGGQSFGYRIISDIVPILIIFLAMIWERLIINRGYLKIIFIILLLFSVYTHLLGAFVYPGGFNFSPDLIDENPQRLWDFSDTQITRCTAKAYNKTVVPYLERILRGDKR